MLCSGCGQENSEVAKFCLACGAALAGDARSGEERRLVTVLFVDLVGFTARAEQLDPEDVRAILAPYHDRVRSEIESFGGTVEKFVGDAVMAVFGAPVAHGDDPERAVRAAFAVRDALGELNEQDPAQGLEIRAAVNTGEAIVQLGARPSHGEAMVAGDVVNTAARLQAAAPVSGVLVGEETYVCTRSAIDYRAATSVDAKGKALPVAAWLAVAPRTRAGERAVSQVPMVGRERELSVLSGIWERVAEERRPHLVTVFGPAGIGKTRLGCEFAELVSSLGGRTIHGRCVPYGVSMPYGPFAQQVKQVAGIFENDRLSDANEKLRAAVRDLTASTDVEQQASHLAILAGLETEASVSDRETLFFSARLLAEALAERQPTMLVFEDIHWADESLLELIEHIAARAREVPLLLLTLARPELLSKRSAWGGGLPAYTTLALDRLAENDAARLAASLLAQHSVTQRAEQTAAVAATAEGNPLFLEELAASLAERATSVNDQLPTSIRAIVGARLDALPPAERAVLLDASVAGRVFWRGLLERLGNHGELSEVLGSLEQRDLVRREAVSAIRGEQQFSFKHVLVRDVAYQTLPRAGRRERHAEVATFLEQTTAESGAAAPALAHHWREAGESGRAVDYLLAAADQAGRGWAKEQALALYADALELVPEDDNERRRSIRLRQAVTSQALFHTPDAERLRGG